MTPPPLSLYVHLPWCERKCPYCDFNSHEAHAIPETEYVDALLRDLETDLPLVQTRDIESVFIGGGTPSLFSATAIAALLEGIQRLTSLSSDIEITMEANPGSAEATKFRDFRTAGVNRLSLGVQSFDNASLAALGRIHTGEQALAAIAAVRDAGFSNFNLDLMHGLPGQSIEAAILDLDTAVRCAPTHLSWYQLTIEPNTVYYSKPPVLPTEQSLGDIQDAGEALLAGAGYRQYEVSAFSQEGYRCRHNLNYWHFGDYLGIGAGAHGKITRDDGAIVRLAKRRQPADYLSAERGVFLASQRELEVGERMGEFAMNALRLKAGFSLDQSTAHTGLASEHLDKTVRHLCDKGLLLQDGAQIRATATGYRFLDSVIAEFF